LINARGGKSCVTRRLKTEGTRGTRSHNEISASVVVGPTEKWRDGRTVACEMIFLLQPEMKNPKYSCCKLIFSVGITTRYGLDGPGIESRWGGRDFPHTSGLAVGPTQPIKWVLGLFPGRKASGAWLSPPTPILWQG